jgi:hypothetical protein
MARRQSRQAAAEIKPRDRGPRPVIAVTAPGPVERQSAPIPGTRWMVAMITPQNSFCFAPLHNHWRRGDLKPQYDATGAFHPYMEAYKKIYSGKGRVATLKFDNHAAASSEFSTIRKQIEHAVNVADSQLDAIVYFGHGWPTGLVSADIYNDHLDSFADLIRRNAVQGVKVILYACLCGNLKAKGGSFAARLASQLSDLNAEVYAHDNAGHTTTNPNMYRFVGVRPPEPVAPKGYFQSFDKMLKAESIDRNPRHNSAFWARMPFMDAGEIAAEVKGYKAH